MMMPSQVYRELAVKYAKKYWNLDFKLPVYITDNPERGLGAFISLNKKPFRIELHTNLIENYADKDINGVLLHELCHWAMYVQGLEWEDGTETFENELKRIGAPATGSI